MLIDITEGKACFKSDTKKDTILLHWGTRYTRSLLYKQQIELLSILEAPGEENEKRIEKCRTYYNKLIAAERRKKFAIRIKNKIKRMLGIT
ncbi:MAG TPA: hypothetical protein DD413_03325 [Ruminococcus sp.]|nr:hypothetical protein [Ruminococcus sp.]